MIKSTTLVSGLLCASVAVAADWRVDTLWNWVVGTGGPKLEKIEADNAALRARVDELESGNADLAAAQVRTSLELLPEFQQAVAGFFRETGEVPVDRRAAGLSSAPSDTQTSYISAVDIINGAIVVSFGNLADPAISGGVLAFTPYESGDLTVSWRCGSDPSTPGLSLLGTASGGATAAYIEPTIPPSTFPEPCVLSSQAGSVDELIRAQILESLALADRAQRAVESYFSATEEAPVDRAMAGMTALATDTIGNYVESVEIVDGTITITFGNKANPAIFHQTLSWTPYESPDLTVVWRCGFAVAPAGTLPLGTAGGGNTSVYQSSTLMERYLPYYCR